ncbi:unnamed protein product [Thlaspi arvense]|uniref:Leucine-rich repeat-containing N-terminal plant-type domain-containing protein n=1 Tax=Thlaspi arvense TaxID=13288 RepID=A0AAU9SNI6_THLAR|nr:unnamed protein product [Thlaspi arvense]
MERKFLLGQYLIWVILLLGQLHGYKSCIRKERKALLELKQYLTSISLTEEWALDYLFPNWTNDTKSDCCRWKGIKCNRTSGRVTEIAFDGLFVKESSLLDLSLLHPFEEVRSLNLSMPELSGLFDDVEGYKSLGRLRNLEILDLSRNRFNNSIFPFLNSATSLKTLFLRGNILDGHFPANELKDLTNLELLDLSDNRFNGSILIQDLFSLKKLKALDLSGNEFSGSIELQGICEMKNMQDLDLSRNKLEGRFPLCLTSLRGLRVLDLSSNQLTGNVPSALGNLESLKYLSLSDNNFEGLFSVGSLANLSELRVLQLGSQSNSFQLESESSWKPKFQLSVIALSSCNLENVPHFLLHQKDLSRIDLSDNKISGIFPHWLLANNTKLEFLFLQNNSLTKFQIPKSAHKLLYLDVSANEFSHLLPENIGWILPHLRYMKLADNNFQGHLPSSLGNMERTKYLDISHNSFQGKLPRSLVMGCYSMSFLRLSHNKLSGEVFSESVNFTDILELSMDNNQFTGKIGQGLCSLEFLELLDISNNYLSGVIPSWLGELPFIKGLVVANNMLEGEIPLSLFNSTRLRLLDLSANTLSGGIPPHVYSERPVVLLLQDNNLSGAIPDTLLTNVSMLDLRNNRLSGNIPEFTNTQTTRTLLLRGNSLTGSIPHQLCGLINIQLLDLANNRLSGSIPSCLSNTSFFLEGEDIFYEYDYVSSSTFYGFDLQKYFVGGAYGISFKSLIVLDPFVVVCESNIQIKIEFATKHRYDSYMGGNLKLMFGMDLSENELSGDIPVELGCLLHLQALNLSHNNLSGVIPKSFSGLKNVESLDLSFNRLQGPIPQQLAELSSLSIFNVSFNNLSGVIPQGRQFNTFDQQSYLGNPLLSGQSINKSFDSIHEPDNVVEADESTIDLVSFYWSFAAAYVTILLGILASLSFDSPWSRAWFYIVDVFIHKVRNVFGGGDLAALAFIIAATVFSSFGSPPFTSRSRSLVLHGYKSCIEKERIGLLEIKQYLISITIEEEIVSVLTSWTNGTNSDCCGWKGLKCDLTSGRVTDIAIDIPYLKDSYLLNLSLLHPFEQVRSLNLTDVAFSGLFDDVEVDIQDDLIIDDVPVVSYERLLVCVYIQSKRFLSAGYKSLGRLRNLEILDLSFNRFNRSIFPFLNPATSLTTLFLRGNNIDGPLPVEELKDLINLELLDLSGNRFNGSIQVQELSTLTKLKALDLSGNEFSESMGLQGKFKHILSYLSFCVCISLAESSGSKYLRIEEYARARSQSKQASSFEGLFSLGSLANLSKLRVLQLGSQSTSFQAESESSWKPKFQLSVIALPSCNLENVPHFLLHQKDLSHIDLSDNKISGSYPHWLLANNTKLEVLFLQNNSLTKFQLPKSAHNLLYMDVSGNEFSHLLPDNIGWILPQLVLMNISNNSFEGNLPSSLGNMKSISFLDISHNSFQGNLPKSFLMGCYSMRILTLSHNNLSGEVFPESVIFTYLMELSMDNNQFTGKIGQGLHSLEYLELLDISNNNLSGVIPSWLGELPSLSALLLSNNSLEGEISLSLVNLPYLELMDLSANTLSGDIPPYINSRWPVVLLLQDNNLSGVIPDTLLTNVTVLDLRNNRLSGNIPEFTNTQNTHTLLLRGNRLTGSISRQLCGLRNIQLLDLANNRLSGSLPLCLSNTSFGLGKEDTSYEYDYGTYSVISDTGFVYSGLSFQNSFGLTRWHSRHFKSLIVLDPFIIIYRLNTRIKIEFATKHRYDVYLGENLKLLFGMDLSENELSGEISIEFEDLLELQALNLSHNHLSGVIPESLSGLKNVESLDLSFNRLQGRIPSQLAKLSSLAVFDVSFNNLSGVIPQGKQFNTFETQSFLGNPLLCGQPTNRSCEGINFQEPYNGLKDDESQIDMVFFYWAFAAAYVTILLGIFASLSFDSPWSRFWFYLVDTFIHKAKD